MLEDFQVEKLGQVNLIVGKNNAGKSSVLEALRIYAGNANQRLLEELAQSHGEKYGFESEDGGFENESYPFEDFFSGRKILKDNNIVIGSSPDSSDNLVVKLGYLEEEQVDRDMDGEVVSVKIFKTVINHEDLSSDTYKEALLAIKNNTVIERIRFREMRRRFIGRSDGVVKNSCSFIPTRIVSVDELARDWDSIVFTEYEEIVKSALRIISEDFLDITFVQNPNSASSRDAVRVAVVKLKNHSRAISLGSLGDGMSRVLQLILKVFASKDGFLLIDEFENGLHYSAQEKVWQLIFEMAKAYNIQVFATTHSRDCVESFSKVANERVDVEGVLFRMGRSATVGDNGKIIATVYDEGRLSRLIESDVDMR